MAETFVEYRVFFTPRVSSNTYGSEIEVTDYIRFNGIKNIKQSIDSTDYEIGVFQFGDINLSGVNRDGIFNDENDSRSIFPFGRDLAKVRVEFTEVDKEVGDPTATISFRGLINDEASRIDATKETISFRVLSEDSVIRSTKVAAGAVSTGQSIASAVQTILNTPRITAVLNVDAGNINPDLETTIDDGSKFDNLIVRQAIDELMLVSNSVFIIDGSSNVIVKSRAEDTDKDIVNLFGPFDIFGRENIVDLRNYNSGKHRAFTSVKFGTEEKSDAALETEFGTSRQKVINIDWITDATKQATIAARVLREFRVQKIELKVTVKTSFAKGVELLDRVSINYPLRLEPPEGGELPLYGITKYGDAEEPYPLSFGSLEIKDRIGFKVIEIVEDPTRFLTTLKLRQVGTELNDGVLDVPTSNLYDFGDYGAAKYGEPNFDTEEAFNPSVYGAGQYGATEFD